jgi:nucleoside-diphosphate-sugar epimerase
VIASFIDNKPNEFNIFGGNDYIYVKEAAKGIVSLGQRAGQMRPDRFEVINLGSGRFTMTSEIIKELEDIFNKKLRFKTDVEGKIYSLNMDKARSLGFSVKYELRQSLSEMADMFRMGK